MRLPSLSVSLVCTVFPSMLAFACTSPRTSPVPVDSVVHIDDDAVGSHIQAFHARRKQLFDAAQRETNERRARGDVEPVSVDLGPLISEYYPLLAPAADRGDPRAIGWCLDNAAFKSAEFEAEFSSGRLGQRFADFLVSDANDELIARAVQSILSVSYMVDDPTEVCLALSKKAHDPEVKARALASACRLVAAGNPKQREILGRLATDYPETTAGQRAIQDLKQLAVLVVGKVFPGYADRRFVDIARAARSANPDPIALMADPSMTFQLSDYRDKVLALIFWDYYCGFCLSELPFERAMYAELAPRGLEIVGVYTDPDIQHYSEQIQRIPVPWRNVWDAPGSTRSGPLCKDLGVHYAPFTVVLDRDGIVRAIGPRKESLKAAIEAVLETGSSTADGK